MQCLHRSRSDARNGAACEPRRQWHAYLRDAHSQCHRSHDKPDDRNRLGRGAGQDNLPLGHPNEYLDSLTLMTLHAPVADYGWPECEENQHAYTVGANCTTP